ncbi:hypothetical protein KFK09_005905 [Dendrobium nobile]|uniref:C2H2-type domain-containing protein n=1 Tax=Dendrobium nobile TaxID=94219 RepID=A0A8T3BWZ2_DENNO|nr:hypothetical protein KFK09_005905 [Dendrobium nobile]
MEKYVCKVCGRSFPSGRSLGGHMRTHVVPSSPMEDEDKPVSKYDLRDNPKKLQRFDDVCPEKEKHMVHARKAKVCFSANSSSVMPRDDEEDDDLWSEGSYDEQAEEMSSQSDSVVSLISMPARKRRRTSQKAMKISAFSAPPASSSENKNDIMNGALCLLMLSRGTHSIPDLPDEISRMIGRGKEVHSFPSEDEDQQQFKKRKISSFRKNCDHGDISSGGSSKQCDCEYGMYKSRKRKKYVCTICKKSFPSYQALGGHSTSHTKMKGANQELINQDCDMQTIRKSPENSESHKCSICGKTFSTGQALGGHKRSHLAEGNSSASAGTNGVHPQPVVGLDIEQNFAKPNSIDLNLPATDNDC